MQSLVMSKIINNVPHKGIAFILLSFALNFNYAQSQQVLSLNPLFTEQTAMLIPEIENGYSSRDDNFSVTLKQLGDNFYMLQQGNATNAIQYEATFVFVADTIFLDLVPKLPDTLGDNDYRWQLMATHSFYKVKILNDTLRLAGLSYRFFYNQLIKNKSLLSYSSVGGGILLTVSTKELKQFIEKHLLEPDFFDQPILLVSDPNVKSEKKKITSLVPENNTPREFFQQCIPEFPHKDGWLGGDADISVPINDTQSMYIFGDTYVGKKSETRQSKELKMVSSYGSHINLFT